MRPDPGGVVRDPIVRARHLCHEGGPADARWAVTASYSHGPCRRRGRHRRWREVPDASFDNLRAGCAWRLLRDILAADRGGAAAVAFRRHVLLPLDDRLYRRSVRVHPGRMRRNGDHRR